MRLSPVQPKLRPTSTAHLNTINVLSKFTFSCSPFQWCKKIQIIMIHVLNLPTEFKVTTYDLAQDRKSIQQIWFDFMVYKEINYYPVKWLANNNSMKYESDFLLLLGALKLIPAIMVHQGVRGTPSPWANYNHHRKQTRSLGVLLFWWLTANTNIYHTYLMVIQAQNLRNQITNINLVLPELVYTFLVSDPSY